MSFMVKDDDIRSLLLNKKKEEHEALLKHFTRRSGVLLDKNTVAIRADALDWLHGAPDASLHAVVTAPPLDLEEIERLVQETSAVTQGPAGWDISPSLEMFGSSQIPSHTSAETDAYRYVRVFFESLGRELMRVLVPGANVFIASNPILSTPAFSALHQAGLEKRGEIVRVFDAQRGGESTPATKEEFPDVSVSFRSWWEPWGFFVKPTERPVADNLRKWGTGALRKLPDGNPFPDAIHSSPTSPEELEIAPVAGLKPQAFLRQIVRASLPLGLGIVVDPFAGGGATLAAAASMDYMSLGVEHDPESFDVCCNAFARLKEISTPTN